MKLGLNLPSLRRLASVPNVFNFSGLPLVADELHYDQKIKALWGPLGNLDYGCCFWAAVANMLMSQQTNSGQIVKVYTEDDVLGWYADATGFRKSDPSTDQGTDPIDGMNWLVKQKIIRAYGQVPITGNDAHLAAGAELFGGVILGVQVPADWMQAKTWGPSTQPIDGGHAIMAAGYNRSCDMPVATWGEWRDLITGGRAQCGMLALVMITDQWIETTGKTLQGFDIDGLTTALAEVR